MYAITNNLTQLVWWRSI